MVVTLESTTIPIKGMLPVSMLDWDGMLASVIFVSGCNFRCPICHNSDLVLNNSHKSEISWKKIEDHLISKKDWLDGVVITGGEPTIHKNLNNFISQIKNLDLAVKLDTNGALPGALAKLLEEKIVDYVAMDIKTTLEKYKLAAGVEVKAEDIKESVAVIKESGVDYEFRTTVVPGISDEKDVLEIAEFLAGAKMYYLQQFKPEQVLEPQASKIEPYSTEEIRSLAKKCNQHVKTRARLI